MHFFASVLLLLAATASAAYDKSACNNSPSLCAKKYSEILYLGAHDSAFVVDKGGQAGLSSAANQYYNATVLLSAGVRMLQAQMHLDGADVKLCHTSCDLFDAGTVVDWLKDIAAWMKDHPSDVVTLLLVNSDNVAVTKLDPLFQEAGIKDLAYTPTSPSIFNFPTLQELVKNKTTAVTFLSTSATTSVPYLIDEFSYVFETAFEVTDPSNFSCIAERPSAVNGTGNLKAATQSRMGLMNHFLYQEVGEGLGIFSPNETYAEDLQGTKATGNLKDAVEKCSRQWGTKGGFVLMDFIGDEDALSTVDTQNGVTNAVNREGFPARTDSKEGGGSSGGGWGGIQKLAVEAKGGTKVKIGQWVLRTGAWIGTVGG